MGLTRHICDSVINNENEVDCNVYITLPWRHNPSLDLILEKVIDWIKLNANQERWNCLINQAKNMVENLKSDIYHPKVIEVWFDLYKNSGLEYTWV